MHGSVIASSVFTSCLSAAEVVAWVVLTDQPNSMIPLQTRIDLRTSEQLITMLQTKSAWCLLLAANLICVRKKPPYTEKIKCCQGCAAALTFRKLM